MCFSWVVITRTCLPDEEGFWCGEDGQIVWVRLNNGNQIPPRLLSRRQVILWYRTFKFLKWINSIQLWSLLRYKLSWYNERIIYRDSHSGSGERQRRSTLFISHLHSGLTPNVCITLTRPCNAYPGKPHSIKGVFIGVYIILFIRLYNIDCGYS